MFEELAHRAVTDGLIVAGMATLPFAAGCALIEFGKKSAALACLLPSLVIYGWALL